jgi:predicted Zn-dependent protease
MHIIKRCLRDHPDYNEGLWLLGDDFYSVSYYDSAILTLEKAHQNNYDDPGFLQLLGDAYRKKNNRSKAAELYKEVLARDSSRAEVYRQLAELEPSRAAWYQKKADAIEESPK